MSSIQNEYSGLMLAKVTDMNLLVANCPNRHTHIFGFYHQVPDDWKEVDIKAMKLTITDPNGCKECGCEVKSSYGLAWRKDVMADGSGI